MTHRTHTRILLTAASFMMVTACGDTTESKQAAPNTSNEPAAVTIETKSPVPRSSPIRFRYEVLGTPTVGMPVSVNVFVSSSVKDAPINLYYRVADASSMLFADSQALQATVSISPGDVLTPQQITVIPQREGRLYLNVSADIQSGNETMMKSMSIPIQVGNASPDLKTNGELIETADGEVVISMPAEQN